MEEKRRLLQKVCKQRQVLLSQYQQFKIAFLNKPMPLNRRSAYLDHVTQFASLICSFIQGYSSYVSESQMQQLSVIMYEFTSDIISKLHKSSSKGKSEMRNEERLIHDSLLCRICGESIRAVQIHNATEELTRDHHSSFNKLKEQIDRQNLPLFSQQEDQYFYTTLNNTLLKKEKVILSFQKYLEDYASTLTQYIEEIDILKLNQNNADQKRKTETSSYQWYRLTQKQLQNVFKTKFESKMPSWIRKMFDFAFEIYERNRKKQIKQYQSRQIQTDRWDLTQLESKKKQLKQLTGYCQEIEEKMESLKVEAGKNSQIQERLIQLEQTIEISNIRKQYQQSIEARTPSSILKKPSSYRQPSFLDESHSIREQYDEQIFVRTENISDFKQRKIKTTKLQTFKHLVQQPLPLIKHRKSDKNFTSPGKFSALHTPRIDNQRLSHNPASTKKSSQTMRKAQEQLNNATNRSFQLRDEGPRFANSSMNHLGRSFNQYCGQEVNQTLKETSQMLQKVKKVADSLDQKTKGKRLNADESTPYQKSLQRSSENQKKKSKIVRNESKKLPTDNIQTHNQLQEPTIGDVQLKESQNNILKEKNMDKMSNQTLKHSEYTDFFNSNANKQPKIKAFSSSPSKYNGKSRLAGNQQNQDLNNNINSTNKLETAIKNKLAEIVQGLPQPRMRNSYRVSSNYGDSYKAPLKIKINQPHKIEAIKEILQIKEQEKSLVCSESNLIPSQIKSFSSTPIQQKVSQLKSIIKLLQENQLLPEHFSYTEMEQLFTMTKIETKHKQFNLTNQTYECGTSLIKAIDKREFYQKSQNQRSAKGAIKVVNQTQQLKKARTQRTLKDSYSKKKVANMHNSQQNTGIPSDRSHKSSKQINRTAPRKDQLPLELSLFEENNISLFLGIAEALKYEETLAISSKKREITFSDDQKDLILRVLDALRLIKKQSPQSYKQIMRFLRYPYQSTANKLSVITFTDDLTPNNLEYCFRKIGWIHRKCEIANGSIFCRHMQTFIGNVKSLGEKLTVQLQVI